MARPEGPSADVDAGSSTGSAVGRHRRDVPDRKAIGTSPGPSLRVAPDAAEGLAPGQRVQALRRARGLSLQVLSARSGLSLGTLSNIERGTQGLSVRSALALGREFGVPVDWMLDAGRPEPGPVQRAGEGRVIDLDHGIRKRLLNPDLAGGLELLLVTLAPGGTSGPEAYTHGGEEAGLVLAGTLGLWVDGVEHALGAGDSFHFHSGRPHRFANAHAGETTVVWALTPPLYQGRP